MRFRLDGHDGDLSQPKPRNSVRLLDQEQCVEFLKLVHEGLGRTMACCQLGFTTPTLNRTLAARPSLRG